MLRVVENRELQMLSFKHGIYRGKELQFARCSLFHGMALHANEALCIAMVVDSQTEPAATQRRGFHSADVS